MSSYFNDCEEDVPLLYEVSEQRSSKCGPFSSVARQNIYLIFLLVTTIATGTANRVIFKTMQYSALNYSYFLSILTTLIYFLFGSFIVMIKLFFTNHISKQQRKIHIGKFFIVALMDSVAALLIVVGGKDVPGAFQNLLLQGVVPMTMFSSILFLRPEGCKDCKDVRSLLKLKKIKFVEKSTHPAQCYNGACMSSVTINGQSIRGSDTNVIESTIGNLMENDKNEVILHTSAKEWKRHLVDYYSVGHYGGALIIVIGLAVCVWPDTHFAGNELMDFLFFLSTLPTALSAVFKEMMFIDVQDLDIWYLTTFVSFFQIICDMPWAPVAAMITNIPVSSMPMNIVNGFNCVFRGINSVTEHCSRESICTSNCCDSCDGSIPAISHFTALTCVLVFVAVNILYNFLLVSVIKHGSAALMYVATTVVLPLSALCFASQAIMGQHAKPLYGYDIAGLILVVVGLMIYRFLSNSPQKTNHNLHSMNPYTPTVFSACEPVANSHNTENSEDSVRRRTVDNIRSHFYEKLGVGEHGNGNNNTDDGIYGGDVSQYGDDLGYDYYGDDGNNSDIYPYSCHRVSSDSSPASIMNTRYESSDEEDAVDYYVSTKYNDKFF